MNNESQYIRSNLVRWIGRHLAVELDNGILTAGEYNLIMRTLRDLSKHGISTPPEKPRLLKIDEVASMLAISKSQFRALEAEGKFSFKRRMVGSSVRYLNLDVIRHITCDVERVDENDIAEETSRRTKSQQSADLEICQDNI